jgi:hypothetical protein
MTARRVPPDLEAEILDAYRSGATLLGLAEQCGVAPKTIRRLLRAQGMDVRRTGRQRPLQQCGGIVTTLPRSTISNGSKVADGNDRP